jgi:hypothetical protein
MCELVYAVKEKPALDKQKLQIAVALTPDNVKDIAHCMDRPGSVLACSPSSTGVGQRGEGLL